MSFKKIKTYILESEFKLIYLNNKINVVNYTSLGEFNNKQITIYNNQEIIKINGSNLIISKLLKDELLIEGKIERIDLND